MDCKLIENLLGDYLDQELNEELKDQVSRHLLQCPRCAWELHSLRETLAALRASTLASQPGAGFRERLLARFLRDHRAAIAAALGPLPLPVQEPSVPFVFELTREENHDVTQQPN
jgi:anti-sigma factor RsiW